MTEETELLTRAGLPDDQLVLARRFPRETWQAHQNVAGTAAFWLERHAMFRRLGGVLSDVIGDHREGRLDAPGFARAFVPKLRFFLRSLQGHHQIEDDHYFPIFLQAERRLARGFGILDRDHHAIHEALDRNAEAADAFLRALGGEADRQRFAADAYADANERLAAMLARHLDDEEDLIVPLILHHGDRRLRL